MKTKNLLTFLLTLVASIAYAQNPDWDAAADTIGDQFSGIRNVGRAIIGLSAVGGAVMVYLKLQSDEGGSGKKGLMNFLGGLIFVGVIFLVIEIFFFG